jgi:hypothetical protein
MTDHDREPRQSFKRLTRASTGAEAAMIVGELAASGIRASRLPPIGYRRGQGGAGIYVRAKDLARAREVLDAPALSEDELVEAEEEDAAAGNLPLGSVQDGAVYTAAPRNGRCAIESELIALGILYEHSRPSEIPRSDCSRLRYRPIWAHFGGVKAHDGLQGP